MTEGIKGENSRIGGGVASFRMSVYEAERSLDNRSEGKISSEVLVARTGLNKEGMLDGSAEEIKVALTQLVMEYGFLNHHQRNYADSNTGNFIREITVDTRDVDRTIRFAFITPKDNKSDGVAELSIVSGERSLQGVTPKSIDIPAAQLRTMVNSAVENEMRNGYIPEDLKKRVGGLSYMGFDIDGTLLNTEDPNFLINEAELQKFADYTLLLAEVGIEPFLFSGRGVLDVKRVTGLITSRGGRITATSICENGSVLYDTKTDKFRPIEGIPAVAVSVKSSVESFLNQELVDNGLGSLEEGKALGISINPTEKGIQVAKASVEIQSEIDRVKAETGRVMQPEDFKPIDIYRLWVKGLIKNGKQDIINLAGAFRDNSLVGLNESDRREMEQYLDGTVSKIVNSATAVDINPCILEDGKVKGITKIEGIDAFARENGLHLDENGNYVELGGIGDSGGDLFLKKSALSCGVWNMTSGMRYDPSMNIKIVAPRPVLEGTNMVLEYMLRIRRANRLAKLN
ncbi:MAG: hypothetical protein KIH89_000935 [Candidatus Shapirobacteria bacterium]|nr:hypothetical protein [Candidatus Shapirobacteria bacterium]